LEEEITNLSNARRARANLISKKSNTMHYTYILRSVPSPTKTYIGATSNLKTRFKDHNAGRSPNTSKYKPWTLEFYCAFANKKKSLDFENYLKSHSGRAFIKKRFIL
jgi:predicted GIY-YIG superfamily endonuclease